MRNRYKIFDSEHIFFISSTIVEWTPIFTSEKYFQILIETLKFYQEHNNLKIYAYVIMPNHFHLIISSDEISKTIASIKKYSAKRIIAELKADNRIDILEKLKDIKKDYKVTSKHQVWQEGFHPQLILNEEMLNQKINYIHYNPVKKGLVSEMEDWKFSSASDYLSDTKGLISIHKM